MRGERNARKSRTKQRCGPPQTSPLNPSSAATAKIQSGFTLIQ